MMWMRGEGHQPVKSVATGERLRVRGIKHSDFLSLMSSSGNTDMRQKIFQTKDRCFVHSFVCSCVQLFLRMFDF